MVIPILRDKDIALYLDKKETLIKLVLQIQKDLNMYGIEFEFQGIENNVYHIMHHNIKSIIEKLVSDKSQKLYSILYRIDLSENDLSQAGLELPNYNYIEIIAHMIIKRELQKVILRQCYNEL